MSSLFLRRRFVPVVNDRAILDILEGEHEAGTGVGEVMLARFGVEVLAIHDCHDVAHGTAGISSNF